MSKPTWPPFRLKKYEAAYYIGVSENTFEATHRKMLTERKEGGSVLFLRTELEALAIRLQHEDTDEVKEQRIKKVKPKISGGTIGAFDKAVSRA